MATRNLFADYRKDVEKAEVDRQIAIAEELEHHRVVLNKVEQTFRRQVADARRRYSEGITRIASACAAAAAKPGTARALPSRTSRSGPFRPEAAARPAAGDK